MSNNRSQGEVHTREGSLYDNFCIAALIACNGAALPGDSLGSKADQKLADSGCILHLFRALGAWGRAVAGMVALDQHCCFSGGSRSRSAARTSHPGKILAVFHFPADNERPRRDADRVVNAWLVVRFAKYEYIGGRVVREFLSPVSLGAL